MKLIRFKTFFRFTFLVIAAFEFESYAMFRTPHPQPVQSPQSTRFQVQVHASTSPKIGESEDSKMGEPGETIIGEPGEESKIPDSFEEYKEFKSTHNWRNPYRSDQLTIPFDDDGKEIDYLRPDVLYSWQVISGDFAKTNMPKLWLSHFNKAMTELAKKDLVSERIRHEIDHLFVHPQSGIKDWYKNAPVFLSRTPLSTFNYGEQPVRFKLKKDVKFYYLNTDAVLRAATGENGYNLRNSICAEIRANVQKYDPENTVFVAATRRELRNQIAIQGEYMVCSFQVFDSISSDTPEIRAEIESEVSYIKNTIQSRFKDSAQVYSLMDKFIASIRPLKDMLDFDKFVFGFNYLVNNENSGSWDDLNTKLGNMSVRNGGVAYHPRVLRNSLSEDELRRQHYTTAHPGYFNLNPNDEAIGSRAESIRESRLIETLNEIPQFQGKSMQLNSAGALIASKNQADGEIYFLMLQRPDRTFGVHSKVNHDGLTTFEVAVQSIYEKSGSWQSNLFGTPSQIRRLILRDSFSESGQEPIMLKNSTWALGIVGSYFHGIIVVQVPWKDYPSMHRKMVANGQQFSQLAGMKWVKFKDILGYIRKYDDTYPGMASDKRLREGNHWLPIGNEGVYIYPPALRTIDSFKDRLETYFHLN